MNEIRFKLKDLKTRVCSDQILTIKELNDSEKINLLHKIAKTEDGYYHTKLANLFLITLIEIYIFCVT